MLIFLPSDRSGPVGQGTGGGSDNTDYSNVQEIASRTQTVSVGDRVEFTCEVIGNPPPTIRWVRDEKPLPATAVITGSQMVIPRVALEDAGKYRCIASNRGGTRQASIELFVRSKLNSNSFFSAYYDGLWFLRLLYSSLESQMPFHFTCNVLINHWQS
jgi:hypothetical protein